MNLSNQQDKIINEIFSKKEGNFIVRACPGSGKTFTVAHLLAKEYKAWDRSHHGIAVLSFTNAAKDEILKKIRDNVDSQCLIGYPHFIGTIDSFLNNFIFLPFGHIVMKCDKKPKLVGGVYSPWYPPNSQNKYSEHNYFDKTTFNINGNLVKDDIDQAFHFRWENKDGSLNAMVGKIASSKNIFFEKGFATQGDANFISYKALKENPQIAKLLANKFPYIILDEAQDTSETQMAILDLLIDSGVKKVVLVGDPDQAIYEWNQARPDLFLSKINSENWISDGLNLNESFRSSEDVCFLASKFSINKFNPADSNEVKNFNEPVKISSWNLESVDAGDFNEISNIVEEFKKRCFSLGIDIRCDNVAILSRGVELLKFVRDQKTTAREVPFSWGLCKNEYSKDACLSKYNYDNGNFVEACKWAIKWCIKAIHPEKKYLNDEDLRLFIDVERNGHNSVFKGSMKACHFRLPSTKIFTNVGNWLKQAKFDEPDLENFKGISFDDIFFKHKKTKIDEKKPLYSTIHGIKGRTFDAVLLFLKKSGGKGRHYKTNLNNGFNLDDENMEEMRNIYVAITRPRKLLWIAVPKDDYEDWKNFSK